MGHKEKSTWKKAQERQQREKEKLNRKPICPKCNKKNMVFLREYGYHCIKCGVDTNVD